MTQINKVVDDAIKRIARQGDTIQIGNHEPFIIYKRCQNCVVDYLGHLYDLENCKSLSGKINGYEYSLRVREK